MSVVKPHFTLQCWLRQPDHKKVLTKLIFLPFELLRARFPTRSISVAKTSSNHDSLKCAYAYGVCGEGVMCSHVVQAALTTDYMGTLATHDRVLEGGKRSKRYRWLGTNDDSEVKRQG